MTADPDDFADEHIGEVDAGRREGAGGIGRFVMVIGGEDERGARQVGIGHRCSHSSHGSNSCVGYTEDRIFVDGIAVSVKKHQAS